LQDEHGVWCDVCEAGGRHLLDSDREDRKWQRIRDWPEILFTSLKRFNNNGTKKSKDVKIPERLDPTEYLEHHAYGEGSRVEYELQSVVSHQGVLETGHYVAHVKFGDKWLRVDDLGGTPAKIVRASSMEDINKDKPKTFTPFLMA
jgi:ubiquitin C-terminal hydrolase